MKKERKAIKEKKKQVEELKKQLNEGKTLVLLNLKNTPTKLLQQIRKKIKEKDGFIKVYKLAVIKRALDSFPEELYKDLTFPTAVIVANEHPYKLSRIFKENMLSVYAKAGQTAEEDIVIEAGETDLPPGPMLSDLKAAGIPVKIEKGKIAVIKDTVLVKKGEKITEMKAKALQILDIKPFKVGVNIHKAYSEGIIFSKEVLDIEPSQLEESISLAVSQSNNLAYNSNYITPTNASLIIAKAFSEGENLAINENIPVYIEKLLAKAYREGLSIQQEGG